MIYILNILNITLTLNIAVVVGEVAQTVMFVQMKIWTESSEPM